jgi:hypothetical protein
VSCWEKILFLYGSNKNIDIIEVAKANINDHANLPVISAIQPATRGENVKPIPKKKVQRPTTDPEYFCGK